MVNVKSQEWKTQQMNWQVSSPLWIFEVKKMPIEEHVQLERHEVVDAKYNIVELVDLAWCRGIHLGFRFGSRANGGEWYGWPTNTNSQASPSPWKCPMTIKFYREHPSEFMILDVMNIESFMDGLNKMSISNIIRRQYVLAFVMCDVMKTSSWDSKFFKLHIVWHFEHMTLSRVTKSVILKGGDQS